MAELQSPQHPLEVLPAMLNLMLVQTGKFFKEAASGQADDLVSARDLLTEVGKSANRRFHEALDELEIECTRAKAVVERDLRKERAKRAERERAAGILTRAAGVVKARSPAVGTKKSPPSNSVDGKVKDDGVQETTESDGDKSGDYTMTNGLDVREGVRTKQDMPSGNQPEVSVPEGVNGSLTKASPSSNENSNKSETIVVDSKSAQAREKSPEKAEPAVAPAPQAPEMTSVGAAPDAQDAAPFESMFNDLEQPSNGNNLDFDLGFSNSEDLLNDSVFQNIDMTNTEETTNLNATSAEDINTLLPGLENYVNDSGDFSMVDLPVTTMPEATAVAAPTNAMTEQPTTGADNAGNASQGIEMAPMESNFDDLFGSGDWAAVGDMGDGAMVDFDEDWFKTDT